MCVSSPSIPDLPKPPPAAPLAPEDLVEQVGSVKAGKGFDKKKPTGLASLIIPFVGTQV